MEKCPCCGEAMDFRSSDQDMTLVTVSKFKCSSGHQWIETIAETEKGEIFWENTQLLKGE